MSGPLIPSGSEVSFASASGHQATGMSLGCLQLTLGRVVHTCIVGLSSLSVLLPSIWVVLGLGALSLSVLWSTEMAAGQGPISRRRVHE